MPKGQPKLVDGVDYYMEDGKMVLTTYFLTKRGYCCNSGCRHCPYKDAPALSVSISVVDEREPGR